MRHKSVLIFVLASLLLLSLPWLGLRDFYSRGEAREALVAQSILESGNWILGQGYAGAVPSKPPFMHWLVGGFSLVQGEVNEFTARLPSALASIIFGFFFFIFLQRRVSTNHAALSLVILATSAEWFRSSSTCRVDMTLAALLAGALLLLFSTLEKRSLSRNGLISLLLALACLTKGPVAVVLPLAAYFIYCMTEKVKFKGLVLSCIGLAIFPIFLLGAWYFLAYLQSGEAFFSKVFYENVARLTSSMADEPHKHNVFYLAGALFVGLAPWSILLAPICIEQLSSGFSLKLGNLKQYWFSLDKLSCFSYIVTLTFFVFFSIPSSKRGVYLLPAYPFLAHLLARLMLNFSARELKVFNAMMASLAMLVLGVFGLSLGLYSGSINSEQLLGLNQSASYIFFLAGLSELPGQISGLPFCFGILTLLLAFVLVVSVGRNASMILPGAFIFSLCLLLNSHVLPYFANKLSGKNFAKQIALAVSPQARILSFNYEFYGFSFYTKRQILKWSESAKVGDYVVLFENDLDTLKSKLTPGNNLETVSVSQRNVEKPGLRALLGIIK